MAHVPGLRSPYIRVGRLVYFGRMLDKIRLHAAGNLPADYIGNFGDSKPGMFDTRCCQFLRVAFADIQRRTLEGGTDEEILAWMEKKGGRRSDDDCEYWNAFMRKRGWRDHPDVVARIRMRAQEPEVQGKPIETFFDYIEFDEGRDPVSERLWEKA